MKRAVLVGKVLVVLLIALALFMTLTGRHAAGHRAAPRPQAGTSASPKPSVTAGSNPTVSPSKAIPTDVTRRLVRLLKASFTLDAQGSYQDRLVRIRPLVSPEMLTQFDEQFGFPEGTTMVPSVEVSDMSTQRPPGQLYIIAPVRVTVTSGDQHYVVLYRTSTVWVPQGASWRLIGFSRDDGRPI